MVVERIKSFIRRPKKEQLPTSPRVLEYSSRTDKVYEEIFRIAKENEWLNISNNLQHNLFQIPEEQFPTSFPCFAEFVGLIGDDGFSGFYTDRVQVDENSYAKMAFKFSSGELEILCAKIVGERNRVKVYLNGNWDNKLDRFIEDKHNVRKLTVDMVNMMSTYLDQNRNSN